MSATTNITTTLQPDEALAQGSASFDAAQRQYIDTQIRGCQQHLADAILNGTHATFVKVASGSATLAKGDVVCLASSALGYATVTLADAAAMSVAGVALGVALLAAAPGTYAMVGINGLVGPSVTGLAATAGYVRVSSAGRAERAVSFSDGDYPLGAVDSTGYLTIARAAVVESSGGSGITSITMTPPLKSTGGSTPTHSIDCGPEAIMNTVPLRGSGGLLEQRFDAVGTAATVASSITNTTTATGGAPQYSGIFGLQGREASGSDQAVWMGLQTRNAGDTSVVQLAFLSKIGAGSWTKVASIDGAGAVGAPNFTASSFVSSPDYYAENIYGLDGSSLAIVAGASETIELRVDATVVATVSDDLFDFAFPIRLATGTPAATRQITCAADGIRFHEPNSTTGNYRTTARRPVSVSSDGVTVIAFDGLITSVSAGAGTTGVELPEVAAGDACCVLVVTDASGSVSISSASGDTFLGVAGPYTQAASKYVRYTYVGFDWAREIIA